jgi:hypothetical protein
MVSYNHLASGIQDTESRLRLHTWQVALATDGSDGRVHLGAG